MRIQLDTTNKTVKVEQTVSLKDLMALLEKILPNKEWEKFSIESNVTINNWSAPIIIEKYVDRYHGPYWYNNNGMYLCSSQANDNLAASGSQVASYAAGTNGLYNLEA